MAGPECPRFAVMAGAALMCALSGGPAKALELTASWQSADTSIGHQVCWTDFNGDGWLDLAVLDGGLPPISSGAAVKLYRNDGGVLSRQPAWTGPRDQWFNAIAWGNLDGDPFPDLAIELCRQGVTVFRGGPDGPVQPAVFSVRWEGSFRSEFDDRALAWSDLDQDGFDDLLVAAYDSVAVFRNSGGALALAPAETLGWTPAPVHPYTSVAGLAAGDPDGDGWPDLAVAYSPSPLMGGAAGSALFRNEGGTLGPEPVWTSARTGRPGWAKLNQDSALDLTINSWGFVGRNGLPEPAPSWGHSCKWPCFGDVDGDGLDDVVNALWERNPLFGNHNGKISQPAVWRSREAEPTGCLAWGDANGDGLPELAAANFAGSFFYEPRPALVYLNSGAIPANGPPQILGAGLAATRLAPDGLLTVWAWISDPRGVGSIVRVEWLIDGSPTGLLLADDGAHGDGAAGDGLFGWQTAAAGAPPGAWRTSIAVADDEGYIIEGGASVTIPASCCQ